MLDSRDALPHRCETSDIRDSGGQALREILRFSIGGFEGSQSQLQKARCCGGPAAKDVNKICTAPARESNLEVKIVKTPWVRSTYFWKLRFAKFAPRCGARAI